jgi:hypothetical protein
VKEPAFPDENTLSQAKKTSAKFCPAIPSNNEVIRIASE